MAFLDNIKISVKTISVVVLLALVSGSLIAFGAVASAWLARVSERLNAAAADGRRPSGGSR